MEENERLLLFKKIDLWEKESINKIQIITENIRIDLQKMLEQSKTIYYNKLINFYLSSEFKLNQFIEQLNQFQLTIKNFSNSILQDRFSKVIGNIILDENNFLAKHTNNNWNYEYILGEQFYSYGRHTILFKIEQNGLPYNIFFGCISSHANQTQISIKSIFTNGWFGLNQVYQHGICNNNINLHGYDSSIFSKDDILHLIIDCDKKQIELYHEDTNTKYILSINITKSPFPWQFLIVLTDKDDCIRILPIYM